MIPEAIFMCSLVVCNFAEKKIHKNTSTTRRRSWKSGRWKVSDFLVSVQKRQGRKITCRDAMVHVNCLNEYIIALLLQLSYHNHNSNIFPGHFYKSTQLLKLNYIQVVTNISHEIMTQQNSPFHFNFQSIQQSRILYFKGLSTFEWPDCASFELVLESFPYKHR